MRVLCKFTHDSSLMADGERFWIVGAADDWFDLTSYNAGPNPIIAAVNLDEGVVHLLTESGTMYAVHANAQTNFTITKIRG